MSFEAKSPFADWATMYPPLTAAERDAQAAAAAPAPATTETRDIPEPRSGAHDADPAPNTVSDGRSLESLGDGIDEPGTGMTSDATVSAQSPYGYPIEQSGASEAESDDPDLHVDEGRATQATEAEVTPDVDVDADDETAAALAQLESADADETSAEAEAASSTEAETADAEEVAETEAETETEAESASTETTDEAEEDADDETETAETDAEDEAEEDEADDSEAETESEAESDADAESDSSTVEPVTGDVPLVTDTADVTEELPTRNAPSATAAVATVPDGTKITPAEGAVAGPEGEDDLDRTDTGEGEPEAELFPVPVPVTAGTDLVDEEGNVLGKGAETNGWGVDHNGEVLATAGAAGTAAAEYDPVAAAAATSRRRKAMARAFFRADGEPRVARMMLALGVAGVALTALAVWGVELFSKALPHAIGGPLDHGAGAAGTPTGTEGAVNGNPSVDPGTTGGSTSGGEIIPPVSAHPTVVTETISHAYNNTNDAVTGIKDSTGYNALQHAAIDLGNAKLSNQELDALGDIYQNTYPGAHFGANVQVGDQFTVTQTMIDQAKALAAARAAA